MPTAITRQRIHTTGASGCGTTTLGRALAARLGWPAFDADDFFWLPTSPPYQSKRPRPERLAMALGNLAPHRQCILSGSVCGWGAEIEASFSLVIFLTVRTEVRLERLAARETAKLGHADPEFLAWAARYDEGGVDMRSRARHEQWLAALTCPVLRLDGERPIAELVDAAVRTLGHPAGSRE